MKPVFHRMVESARRELEQELRTGEELGGWDSDSFEEQVREFVRELEKATQAGDQAVYCPCGRRRRVQERKKVWWLTTFGRVEAVERYLTCPEGHGYDRPFQRLTGLSCRGKSEALQRALTDFGAEKSFAQASQQLREHYGVQVDPSSVRQVVEGQAQRAERFVAGRIDSAVQSYRSRPGYWPGEEGLIVQCDGSMIRTGSLELAPEGGQSPKRHLPKRRRQTDWREVRLSVVERPGDEERIYGAVMGSPGQVGRQMFALATVMGWGDHTQVHGVGDGAPWIAQQMEEVFPRHRYLLDRYHLLEHIHTGAASRPEDSEASPRQWVDIQMSRIDAGDVSTVISECRKLAGQARDHPLAQLAGYLDRQRHHLDYEG
ncbi:MAG: hypothetical protein ACE5JL_13300, partial [Dehalococcoidia bacterium]